MQDLDWNEYWSPIQLSLQVALLSSVLVIVVSLVAAWWISRLGSFKGKTFVEIFPSFKAAFVLGFARGLGEFGATLMIAGNIPGKTQMIPTAIYIAVDSGYLPMAWAWVCSMIFISFIMLSLTGQKKD